MIILVILGNNPELLVLSLTIIKHSKIMLLIMLSHWTSLIEIYAIWGYINNF